MYQKLGIIVITDQELLTTLSYKSNRNWALPPLELSLSSQPVGTATTESVSGLCRPGKTYLVTYSTELNPILYDSPGNYKVGGYQQAMHSGYIQRIDYGNDSSGMDKYMRLSFPSRSFPYLRNEADAKEFSATGWFAHFVNIIMKEVDTSGYTGINSVASTGWTKMVGVGRWGTKATGRSGPEMQAKQFVLSREDYEDGSEYELGDFFGSAGYVITGTTILLTSGLTYGQESFFHGDIKCGHVTKDHILAINLELGSNEYNSSKNSTFDGRVNDSTYITEVALFNSENVLVGTAKPSYPIRKGYDRHLSLKLELIY